MPAESVVTALTLRVNTLCRYISIMAITSAFSVPLVPLE